MGGANQPPPWNQDRSDRIKPAGPRPMPAPKIPPGARKFTTEQMKNLFMRLEREVQIEILVELRESDHKILEEVEEQIQRSNLNNKPD